jgi:hypothetical protein
MLSLNVVCAPFHLLFVSIISCFCFVRGGIFKCALCLQKMNQVCCYLKNHKRDNMFCIVVILLLIWWMVSLLWLMFTTLIVGVVTYNGYI